MLTKQNMKRALHSSEKHKKSAFGGGSTTFSTPNNPKSGHKAAGAPGGSNRHTLVEHQLVRVEYFELALSAKSGEPAIPICIREMREMK